MSSSALPPSLSLRECCADGSLDVIRYHRHSKKKRHANGSHLALQSTMSKNRGRNTKHVDVSMKRQRSRSAKKNKILLRDLSGSIREIKPTDTLWYVLRIESSPRSNH